MSKLKPIVRQVMFRTAPLKAAPRTTHRMAGLYDPSTDLQTPRPGATNALALPSRMGDRLYYRDGSEARTSHGGRA